MRDIIRIGDLVRVINPEFFHSCRYENNIQSKTLEVIQEHGEKIRDFYRTLIHGPNYREGLIWAKETDFHQDKPLKMIARGIAYELVSIGKRSGNKKQVFTTRLPDYAGTIMKVSDIRFVHSGTYDKGWYSPGNYYDCDDDWEPPSLYDRKVHKILKVHDASFWCEKLEIEAIQVKKINPEEMEDEP